MNNLNFILSLTDAEKAFTQALQNPESLEILAFATITPKIFSQTVNKEATSRLAQLSTVSIDTWETVIHNVQNNDQLKKLLWNNWVGVKEYPNHAVAQNPQISIDGKVVNAVTTKSERTELRVKIQKHLKDLKLSEKEIQSLLIDSMVVRSKPLITCLINNTTNNISVSDEKLKSILLFLQTVYPINNFEVVKPQEFKVVDTPKVSAAQDSQLTLSHNRVLIALRKNSNKGLTLQQIAAVCGFGTGMLTPLLNTLIGKKYLTFKDNHYYLKA